MTSNVRSQFIREYSENGDLVSSIDYDENGNVISSSVYEYTYNEDCICTYEVVYINDVISMEVFHNPDNSGSSVVTKQVYYHEDGTVDTTYTYEYEYDEFGNRLCQREYIDGVLSFENAYECDEDGCTYIVTTTEYDENGNVTYILEHESDCCDE